MNSNGWIPKNLAWINILVIVLKVVFLKFLFQELHNDYPVAPDEIKIKREILSDYQLNFANLYNIPIANVTKLMPNLQN